jgi:hypothetical protein
VGLDANEFADAPDERPRWQTDPDPVWVHARREAWAVLALWTAGLAWTIGCCAVAAYGQGKPAIVAGLPAWVWSGVLLPWGAAAAFTVYFCIRGIRDDPLDGAETTRRDGG